VSKSSIRTLIAAACVSVGAVCVGRYTFRLADDLQTEAVSLPPRDMIGPKVPPPITEQRKVTKLGGNPANWEDGRLVPKDPVLRQKGENADTYYTISQVSGYVVWAAPLPSS
jgi:hypothetical protein